MDNLWLKVENIVAKEDFFSFVTMFSKSCLLQRRQRASIWGKGLKHSNILELFNTSNKSQLTKLSQFAGILMMFSNNNMSWQPCYINITKMCSYSPDCLMGREGKRCMSHPDTLNNQIKQSDQTPLHGRKNYDE